MCRLLTKLFHCVSIGAFGRRWHIIARNLCCNIHLHRWHAGDSYEDGLHDHQWSYLSILLWGRVSEIIHTRSYTSIPNRWMTRELPTRFIPGSMRWRPAEWSHAVTLKSKVAWTLIITGPVRRDWGFYTRDGWRPATEVLGEDYRKRADLSK